MDTFQNRGAVSSPLTLDYDQARRRLAELCTHGPLQKIKLCLDDSLHVVGGTVRDVFLGRQQVDLDVATRLRPEQVARNLSQHGIRVIETGIDHGTLTALVDDVPIEVTTFRRPGTRDSNAFSDDLTTDLSGRDFTFNAIAFHVASAELVDPWDGIRDLERGIVRAVGDAHTRFAEDPLRLLRMVRFGPAQSRAIEDSTARAASFLSPSLSTVAVERVRSEITKILLAQNAAAALQTMLDFGFLRVVLAELIPMVGFEQNEFHQHDVFQHTLKVVENCPPDLVLRLTALFHDAGKPMTLTVDEQGRRHFYLHEQVSEQITHAVMERLKFSRDETRQVAQLVSYHMRPLECGESGVRRLIRDLGPLLEPWLTFKEADSRGTKMDDAQLQPQLDRFRGMVEAERQRSIGSVYGRLAVDGNDLIALGLKEGPEVGRVLKSLDQMVIDDPSLNERELLLGRARTLINVSE